MISFDAPQLLDADGNAVQAEFLVKDGKITARLLEPARLKEAVLFEGSHGFSSDAAFYGDGYQKLAQYDGTISHITDICYYNDKSHYKMPQTPDFHTAYNYACVTQNGRTTLFGAASCRRFRTEIRINRRNLIIAQCLENIACKAGEVLELEEMAVLTGEKNAVLQAFGERLCSAHPPRTFSEMPTGWCSWYCIGPDISEQDIFENLAVIRQKCPELKYIQIDDGFQPYMGDWLETSDKFQRPMAEICRDIKAAGFEPAIWLAPFIASPKSRLFREHPDYFVMDEAGAPLRSDTVTFGGWRDGPWYFLDGTNPDAQQFLTRTVREIYENWGVKYFKLDANVWGALPFGVRHDRNATSIEAYRRGMEAFWRGIEGEAFVLGCNAPMWASLGEVTAMRVTDDIVRSIRHVAGMSRQCFYRNWMNNTLWINDPDCLIMAGTSKRVMDAGGMVQKTPAQDKCYRFNNIYVRASGGIVLSGDYVSKYSEADAARLQRILNAPHKAAAFDDAFEVGTIAYDDCTEYCIFNRKAFRKKYAIPVEPGFQITDLYENRRLPVKNGSAEVILAKNGSAWLKVEKA